MLSHSYNARLNSFTSIEEGTATEVSASNDTIVDTPPQTSANTSQFSETATLKHKSGKTDDFQIWWSRQLIIKLERYNYQKPSSRERASQKKSKYP